ncbi:hypothetical protein [Vibrio sp. CAU 1672]|uniref:hypothetical protein n=1 Tax=Vibrio sp. CAU 1672 TaxID=3032594 RepID=UPI0023DC933D|nr:hypothetical protein [Vibrio sp. CAU 1672]MDF2153436.1 hypothetical protein [Vibrio sp. CAU 1672]
MKHAVLTLSIAGAIAGSTLFSPVVTAEPVAWDRKNDVWLTQETEHFNVSFRQGHEAQASRALDIAEQVHSELAGFFGVVPAAKTELVLVDEFDYSNGWATPLPFAQIRLIMSPPEDINSLENNDEWLHTLIRHEYAHILHMEMGTGSVSALRKVFGRNMLLFPHALTPSFLLEGLAVYLETNKQLGYGRLQGSTYAMEMRMEVVSGNIKDLDQVAVATRELPLGYNYLYGAYFVEYLSETYGEEKLQVFLTQYSSKLLPFFLLQKTAEQSFGKNFTELWADFQLYLDDRFKEQISQMRSQTVSGEAIVTTPFQQVTASSTVGLLVDVNNGEDRREIQRLSVQAQPSARQFSWSTVSNEKNIIAMDYSDTNGLMVSRLNPYIDGRVFADLYLLQQGVWTQITQQERFRKVRWLKATPYVIASKKVDGLSELWLLNSRDKTDKQRLWHGDTDVVLGGFDVAADGKSLVASIKRPQQGWNLEQLDLETYQWTGLTDSKATENNPVYWSDSKVLYSADYDGVYNIYSLDLDSGMISKVTQEVGGAFMPQWQKGLGLVYQSYDADGYTIRAIETPQAIAEFDISTQDGRFNYPDPVQNSASKSVPEVYSPWSTLRPRTWLPIWASDDQQTLIGAATNGSDALGRHNYVVSASWDSKNDIAGYNIQYAYDNRWLVQLERSHSFSTFTEQGRETFRIERDDSALLQRSNIYNVFEDKLSLNAGVFWDSSREIKAPEFAAKSYVDREETLSGLALAFDNREFYLNVPGVAWGHYADLVAETNDLFHGDYQGAKYQGQWNMTWDLPGRTTLTMRIAGGYADDKAKAFRLGGNDLEQETALFGRDTQALRGYDESAQRGHRYATQRLSARTWLGRVEQNWSLYPVGLGDISASVFVDSGSVWGKNQSRNQLTGAGTELTVEAKLGYGYTVPITLGYAHGFDEKLGKDKFYIGITSLF